jgi:hypothetical protein
VSPAKAKAKAVLAAKESFSADVEGRELFISMGTRVASDHPLVAMFPALFEDVTPKPDLE